MSTYVMSDLHGEYELYLAMLEKIEFKDQDMLYILGDIVDRGPHPIKILLDIMERPNVEVIVGNHCVMAIECLQFLMKEITEDNLENISEEMIGKLLSWQRNGSATTTEEFRKCNSETKRKIINFIADMEVYEEIEVNGKQFILVHAGLGNFEADKELWEYELEELIWEELNYAKQYFSDKYIVVGHKPTQLIEGNLSPGYIYHANNNIAIDCGACFTSGRLACLRLDDMKEFYIENKNDTICKKNTVLCKDNQLEIFI